MAAQFGLCPTWLETPKTGFLTKRLKYHQIRTLSLLLALSFSSSFFSDFLRSDDAFILRFLRARKFDTFEAFKLFGRYFEYRQNNPNLFSNFQASEKCIKEALYDGIPGVLESCDSSGRRIIVLYSANWDNQRYGLAAIYRALLLTLEKLVDEEECQINGFVIVVDWSQFTFRQSTWLNPKILKLMIEGLQVL